MLFIETTGIVFWSKIRKKRNNIKGTFIVLLMFIGDFGFTAKL